MARKAPFVLVAAFLMMQHLPLRGGEQPAGAPPAPKASERPAAPAVAPARPPAPPPAAAAQPAEQGTPVLATLQGLVGVEMKKGSGYRAYYGGQTLYGVKSPKSNDEVLVLVVPGAGEIQVPTSAVERITPVPPVGGTSAAVPAASGATAIRTTHVVHLKNGQMIRGSVVPGPEDEPLKLDINAWGRISISRNRIAKVEESPGEIRFPAPEPAEPPSVEPPTPPAPEEARPTAIAPPVSPELKAEIEEYVFNITRWRHRDRTWAESRLVAIGPPAIPYLRPIIHDPFNLARRAGVRIIRDVGDPAGIPLAIEGLLDEDDFVRETAAEALRKITGLDLGYRPYDRLERRLEAYRRWRAWWEEEQKRVNS